ncbi:unnamed protein product [Euphydryas editha]|uniref:DUF7041 domain-containing protein n=1 Tax=Euphydryas editha TaxID=104508 RepID=A0AAU9VC58_EUPED|nr:unnamed protein product [Euphydryas editha]
MSDSSDSLKSVGSEKNDHVTTRHVPPFSPEDPELWFALIEGQFNTHDVTDDLIKFTQVINNLDLQYAKAVKDIIVNPPANNKYDKIKFELIKRFSASREKKMKQLLNHEELGDRKPSQFLRHLQDLAGPSVPEDFIRTIWSNRLPHNIQTVLVSQPTHSLEQLADIADRIQELTSPYNAAAASSRSVHDSHASDEIAELKKMVEHLTIKLEEHTRASCCSTSRSRPREQRRSTSRQRSRSQSSYKKYPVCRYHAKFGERARYCIKPCDFTKAGNSTSGR